jgi:hypothetical protein
VHLPQVPERVHGGEVLKDTLLAVLAGLAIYTVILWVCLRFGDTLFGGWVPQVLHFMKSFP